MKPKAVIFSAQGKNTFQPEQSAQLDANLDCRYVQQLNAMGPGECAAKVGDAGIAAFTRRLTTDFNHEYIHALNGVQSIAVFATGYEWLDIDELKKRDITVCYIPDYSTITVAEHTLAMMLTMTRRIHLSVDRGRGLIDQSVSLRGSELHGKTVGFIGFGAIGQAVAGLLAPFACPILYYDMASISSDIAEAVSMQQVLQQSDVVCVAASKRRGESPVIDKEALQQFKTGAMLINPARASLVDNEAVLQALRDRKLAAYAVDDYQTALNASDIEPGRVLQTGHTAWYSDEAMQRGIDAWVQNIVALAHGKPINVVNTTS